MGRRQDPAEEGGGEQGVCPGGNADPRREDGGASGRVWKSVRPAEPTWRHRPVSTRLRWLPPLLRAKGAGARRTESRAVGGSGAPVGSHTSAGRQTRFRAALITQGALTVCVGGKDKEEFLCQKGNRVFA